MVNTTHDFWRMVWEQNSHTIIMLTNVVEKTRVRAYAHHITSHHIAHTHFTFVVFLHHMHHTTCVHHAYLLTNTHTYCMYVRTYTYSVHAHSRAAPPEICITITHKYCIYLYNMYTQAHSKHGICHTYVRTYSPPCIVISPTTFHPCPPIVPPCHTHTHTSNAPPLRSNATSTGRSRWVAP